MLSFLGRSRGKLRGGGDAGRLEQIACDVLEDTNSELDSFVLFEISTLCLKSASQVLSRHSSTVLQRAKLTWQRAHPLVPANYLQNKIFGTFYSSQDRLDELASAEERILGLLFHMEELLLDIASSGTRLGDNENERGGDTRQLLPSKQARLWTKSRKTAKLMCVLVSQALNLPLLASKNGSCTTGRGMRAFLRSVLDALLPASTSSSSSGLAVHTELALKEHMPFWRRRRGASPVPLPSLRQVITLGSLLVLYFKRDEVWRSLESFGAFVQRNVWAPARGMFVDLFVTSAVPSVDKPPLNALEDAQQSLQRMLSQFNLSSAPGEVSQAYEREILHPFVNAVVGQLVPLALVQVQVMKIESLKLAGDLERILKDNHFNSQLLVALPSFVVAWHVVAYGYRLARYLLVPDEEVELLQRSNSAHAVKFALWEIETLLIREDDGPALFSNLSVEDEEDDDEEGESESENEGVASPSPPPPLSMRDYGRVVLGGELVIKIHELIMLLHQARSTLFAAGGDAEDERSRFKKAMRDARILFPREGWSAHARIQVLQSLQRQF